MKYPEIFDFSDMDAWKLKYLRKELLSSEWDLMANKPLPDVFEVPFFTPEFCDKLIENIKGIKWMEFDRWGTKVDSIILSQIEGLDEVMKSLIQEYVFSLTYHFWRTEGRRWKEAKSENIVLKMKQNQDIRLHHDFVNITTCIRLDCDSEGGELVFPKYNGIINPEQGYLYVYPGQITHRYGVRNINKGDRYYLMSYLNV
jgi:hypothetical protein